MIRLRKKILQEYRRLGNRKYRKKSGKMVLEGPHLLKEAFKAGVETDTVLFTPEFLQKEANRELLSKIGRKIKTIEVPTRMFQAVAQTESPQGVGAIANLPRNSPPFSVRNGESYLGQDDHAFFLIIDELQDPGNLGTIIRTAAAAAINGIFLLPGTVEPYNPKVLRASMGGIFYLPVLQVELDSCLNFLMERNIRLVAADPHGDRPYYTVDFSGQSCAVVIGNESRGVQESLLRKADIRACIPLGGKIAALNAAVASAVFIFESRRQKES